MSGDDEKHLNLLSIFHYIVGAITALFACFPFLHVFMGICMVSGKFFKANQQHPLPPEFPQELFGWFFIILGSVFILIGWSLAICTIIAGMKLKQRKGRIFCMVMAGVQCIFFPFGTALGVFTIIVISKDSVKRLFESPQVPPPILP